MNVLVYAGNGTTAECVRHCIESLRLHLSPYYAVVSVSEAAILNDPWMSKTSLLVFPGGADIPYCRSLNGEGNRKIAQFVRKGGKFIGFCAGGYYASSRCEFQVGQSMEVSGSRELRFFPGTARGCVYPGFTYNSHNGARTTPLKVNDEALPNVDNPVYNYYNGGGYFVNASQYPGVEVLASYEEPLEIFGDNNDRAAVIYCKVGNGDVLLTGSHPEFTPSLLKADESPEFSNTIEHLRQHDTGRKKFLQACLTKLGLRVNKDIGVTVPRITPTYLSSYMNQSLIVQTVEKLKQNLDIVNGNSWEDTNDTFCLHPETEDDHEYFLEGGSEIVHEYQNADDAVKHIKVFTSRQLPDAKVTPYFNMQTYFDELESLWKHSNSPPGEIGSLLGYSEVVSSTNTLLDKNTRWLPLLPHGTTLTATTQVAGRGRGGNLWINPKGVMALSILFKIPPANNQTTTIVTLQYMCSLALIELILGYGEGYELLPVKLKWPNDIYILKPDYLASLDDTYRENPATVDGEDEMYAKVSGAIVNSQFIDKQFHLVWGGGVNVSNEAPTTSLNIVLAKMNELRKQQGQQPLPPYRHELLLARLVYNMENYFNVFKNAGLQPFLPLYYKRWLHTNQTVNIDMGNHTVKKCTIRGITVEYGLLIAEDVATGEKYELQPDGNSFDIFKGLVYKKSN